MQIFSNNWQIYYRNLLVICRNVTIKDLKSKMLLLLLLQLNTNIEMLLLTDDKFRSKLYNWWPFKTSSRKTKYAFEYIFIKNRLLVSVYKIRTWRTWRFTNMEWMELENSNGTHFQAVLCTVFCVLCTIFCTVLCTHSSDRVLSEISSQLQLVSCSTGRPPDPSPLRPAQCANRGHEF